MEEILWHEILKYQNEHACILCWNSHYKSIIHNFFHNVHKNFFFANNVTWDQDL